MKIVKYLVCLGMLCLSINIYADTGSQGVQQAAQENKFLFLFFYKDQNDKTTRLQNIFDQATLKLGKEIKSVKVKVNDPSEKEISDRFDLKRTPMPFVLVLAPNGAITGGFYTFTEEQLLESVTSQGVAQCLKALQDNKLVFLCLQNDKTAHNEEALKGVRDFKSDTRFNEATVVVLIDPSNDKEQTFLKQISVNPLSNQATTVLISPPAEIISTYQGSTNKEQFISDLQCATTDCCPGGCCPGGCCPGGKCCP